MLFILKVYLKHADPLSETRSGSIYVPRDEAFSEVKNVTFSGKTLYSALHAVVPALESIAIDKDLGFPHFTAIDSLFNEGIHIPGLGSGIGSILPRLIKFVSDLQKDVLLFETPDIYQSNHYKNFSPLISGIFKNQFIHGMQEINFLGSAMWNFLVKL